jgi:hypothetical protein
LMQFFICLILQRVSSYISVFGAFLLSFSFHKLHSILYKTERGCPPTTDHTGLIVIHIHPQYRYCLSCFWGSHDPWW